MNNWKKIDDNTISNGVITIRMYEVNTIGKNTYGCDIHIISYEIFSKQVLKGKVPVYKNCIRVLDKNLWATGHSIIHSGLGRYDKKALLGDFSTVWWNYSREYLERQLHFIREKQQCTHN